MIIYDVDSRFPGSCHDSFIWSNSRVKLHLEHMYECGRRNFWLLGDSGYPLQPWLLPPYRSNTTNLIEIKFNKLHKQRRSLVERAIGLLKARFRCLQHERIQRYSPEIFSKIIVACAIMHNICIKNNIPLDLEIDLDEEVNFNDRPCGENAAAVRRDAENIRNSLANSTYILVS